MVELPEPANVSVHNGKLTLSYESLVARRRHVFTFLDEVFTYSDDDPLRGATATRMVPVTEEEMENRMEQLRDYEHSRLAHIYDEGDNQESWEEWIEGQIRREGRRLVYDPSHEGLYGPKVEELAKDELGYENVAVVECIGGGRAFNEVEKDFDNVYNEELLKVMRGAEADMAGNFWDNVVEKAKQAKA